MNRPGLRRLRPRRSRGSHRNCLSLTDTTEHAVHAHPGIIEEEQAWLAVKAADGRRSIPGVSAGTRR